MKLKTHRKSSRKRYRKLAAAVAGAAVLSSTFLPGLPFAKVHASAGPSATYSTAAEAEVTGTQNKGPVQAVRDAAKSFGFSSSDRFSLLSSSDTKATVRVRSDGRTFKVDLKKSGGTWIVTTIRGIGNGQTPATYTPASMFNYQPPIVTPGTSLTSQILFQTNRYNNWTWLQSKLPEGTSFGVLLKNRSITGPSVSNSVLDQTRHVDFNHQFAVFAQLGSVASKGYGIGIASVVQAGNDVTVTVRSLSPQATVAPQPSQTADVVILDRASLNFNDTIRVTFANPDGSTITSYTLSPI